MTLLHHSKSSLITVDYFVIDYSPTLVTTKADTVAHKGNGVIVPECAKAGGGIVALHGSVKI